MKTIIIFVLLLTFSFAGKYPYTITTNSQGQGLKLIFDYKYAPSIARDLADYKLLQKSDLLYKGQAELIAELAEENEKLNQLKDTLNKNEKIKTAMKAGLVGAGIGSVISVAFMITIRILVNQ